jgi:hypothetical protein
MTLLKRNHYLVLILCTIFQAVFAAAQHNPEKGLWLSDGYGLLLEIDHDEIRAFQQTSISCIPGWRAQRDRKSHQSNASVFIGNATFRLSDGSSADVKRLHVDGTVSDIVLRRTADFPTTCARKPDNSPQGNYAAFWQTFAEQYPFFYLHQTDWAAVDREFRPQVTSATPPDQLFEVLKRMIEPLQDAHTGIAATDIKKDFDGLRKDPHHLEDEDWKTADHLIANRYVRGRLRPYCDGRIEFGMLHHSIGYLRISAFYGYAGEENSYERAQETLRLALNDIFRDANKLKGLVIDVRLNHGGDDQLGIEIASRLTDRKYLAYAKAARNNLTGPLHFTAAQDIWVVPSKGPNFHGDVVLLIGPDTVSAGETFTMALLGREPHVSRIGLNTQGVFSDVLNRSLPNGWRFRLPNEVYRTSDGTAFDGVGVPPDIRVSFFSRQDLGDGRDAALEKAEDILSKSLRHDEP